MEDADADLLRRWRRDRDQSAFASLVARHADAAVAAAERQLRRGGLNLPGDDAAQAAWVVLARRARHAAVSCRLHGSLDPWLRRTAALCAKAQVKGEHRRRRRERVAAVPDETTPGDAAQRELAEAVAVALKSLPRRDRRLLTLRHLDGRPWPEVASLTNTTPDAARKAASRASVALRRRLEKLGVTAAPPAILAALSRLAEAGRFLPPAPVLPALLARRVILMSNLKTAAVLSLVAAGLVGGGGALVAVAGQDGGSSTRPQVGPRDLTGGAGVAESTVITFEPSGPPEVLEVDVGDLVGGSLPSGLTERGFLLLHGIPPRVKPMQEIDFDAVPLDAAIDFIANAGVPIMLDRPALNAAGISDATELTMRFPASDRFDHFLRRFELATAGVGEAPLRVAWRFGTYVVTTPEGLEAIDFRVLEDATALTLEAVPAVFYSGR